LHRCYDKKYVKVQPLPVLRPQEDMAKRFFEYNNGVHLSEGAIQKIFYNTNHEECGDLCIKSPQTPGNVRCLSFDFYEFPSTTLSQEEITPNRGVCVLNSANQDDARLRNVDQGYTDEELFSDPYIAGHYRLRLSNFGGHYAVRNPRGGQLAEQLDYPIQSPDDLYKVFVWGGSRWGIAHIPPWEPNTVQSRDVLGKIDCTVPGNLSRSANQLTYFAGFTPIDINQKCVGLQDKAGAISACYESGGFLCPTQEIAKSLEGRKLGCSFDGYPVWSADVPQTPGDKRFVRCCAKYSYPNFCQQQYNQANIDFCSQYTTFRTCQYAGTGYATQNQWGFGRLLKSYRDSCVASASDPNKCIRAQMQDWAPRDRCIWCLQPGTGQGQCRAGNDFGVCSGSPPIIRDRFANILSVMCGKDTTCRVANKYPDITCFLLGTCSAVNSDPSITPCASYSGNQLLCNAKSDFCYWVPSSGRCLSRSDDE
jgi:hypothetical protein